MPRHHPKRSVRRSASLFLMAFFMLLTIGEAAGTEDKNASSGTGSIVDKLRQGIVLDVSANNAGVPLKMLYDPLMLDAIIDAGFKSIRIYVASMQEPSVYQTIIDNALERGLAVMISLWGNGEWINQPLEGLKEFVKVWKHYAVYYKDYPDGLVYDLWNEPGGIVVEGGQFQGIKNGDTVMFYLNAVIPAIREINPTRLLGIGGPGLNGVSELTQYVRPEYLDYKLEDGSGYEEDPNIIGLFHMYKPTKFSHWISPLRAFPDWQEEVRSNLDSARHWSERWQKPVLLSEWGAWAPPCRPISDYRSYLEFVVEECKQKNISWIYYTAGYNNQWGFNILDSNTGWNRDALEVLTGISSTVEYPLSSVVNGEFGWTTDGWTARGSATISLHRNAMLDGNSALRIQASKSKQAEVLQETPVWSGSPPNRHLISLHQSKRYEITFLAWSLNGAGSMRVALRDASGSGKDLWISDAFHVSEQKNEYRLSYIHTGDIFENVQLAFLLNEKDQTILLDRIALRGYPVENKKTSRLGPYDDKKINP